MLGKPRSLRAAGWCNLLHHECNKHVNNHIWQLNMHVMGRLANQDFDIQATPIVRDNKKFKQDN